MEKFNKGDKVSYIVSKRVGRGFKVSSREGVFVKYSIDNNCIVKSKNGRELLVSLDYVTPISKRNALTKILVGEL